MIVPDVNLLLYAVITGFPHHQRTRAWWEGLLNGDETVGLTHPAIFGFLRIVTSARVLEVPLPLSEATAYIHDWLAQPNVELLVPGRDHMKIALGLLLEAGTAGNLTTDAQLAAHAIEHRGRVHSNDTDFARFESLEWVNPLKS